MKWVWHTRNFKCLVKRSDADYFILISISTWVSGSRWYTSEFDVVDYGTFSLKSPHRHQRHMLRPLKQHLAGQLLQTEAKIKQLSPSAKRTWHWSCLSYHTYLGPTVRQSLDASPEYGEFWCVPSGTGVPCVLASNWEYSFWNRNVPYFILWVFWFSTEIRGPLNVSVGHTVNSNF